MLTNLENGLAEDGNMIQLNDTSLHGIYQQSPSFTVTKLTLVALLYCCELKELFENTTLLISLIFIREFTFIITLRCFFSLYLHNLDFTVN